MYSKALKIASEGNEYNDIKLEYSRLSFLLSEISFIKQIYEKGVILKAHCEAKLKTAKMKIDKIISHPDGDFSSEPLDEI